jgi:hypothetical protein
MQRGTEWLYGVDLFLGRGMRNDAKTAWKV